MIFLIDIFNDIADDFNKSQYVGSSVLSRKFILNENTTLLVSVYRSNMICEVSVQMPDDTNVDSLKSIPKWKGMEEKLSMIHNDGIGQVFLSFKQLEDFDKKIFFVVLQDIVETLIEQPEKETIFLIKEILLKWNTFFQFDKNYILSENVQQGLYGELYILEKVIKLRGENAINCWTGCNAESHDFYFGKDALEVKSSSSKRPDKVNISNEFQLDDTGLIGRLYLMYIKMKKSEIDGESLPDIVERIADKLSTNSRLTFLNKLLKVGYLHQMPEIYTLCFRTREESCYAVKDGFPRITTKTISKGIGSVDYVVSLDACNPFQITVENFYKGVEL